MAASHSRKSLAYKTPEMEEEEEKAFVEPMDDDDWEDKRRNAHDIFNPPRRVEGYDEEPLRGNNGIAYHEYTKAVEALAKALKAQDAQKAKRIYQEKIKDTDVLIDAFRAEIADILHGTGKKQYENLGWALERLAGAHPIVQLSENLLKVAVERITPSMLASAKISTAVRENLAAIGLVPAEHAEKKKKGKDGKNGSAIENSGEVSSIMLGKVKVRNKGSLAHLTQALIVLAQLSLEDIAVMASDKNLQYHIDHFTVGKNYPKPLRSAVLDLVTKVLANVPSYRGIQRLDRLWAMHALYIFGDMQQRSEMGRAIRARIRMEQEEKAAELHFGSVRFPMSTKIMPRNEALIRLSRFGNLTDEQVEAFAADAELRAQAGRVMIWEQGQEMSLPIFALTSAVGATRNSAYHGKKPPRWVAKVRAIFGSRGTAE